MDRTPTSWLGLLLGTPPESHLFGLLSQPLLMGLCSQAWELCSVSHWCRLPQPASLICSPSGSPFALIKVLAALPCSAATDTRCVCVCARVCIHTVGCRGREWYVCVPATRRTHCVDGQTSPPFHHLSFEPVFLIKRGWNWGIGVVTLALNGTLFKSHRTRSLHVLGSQTASRIL